MIKTILFDVDGVILSEERYFDASALTVWEMIHSDAYLGLAGDDFDPAPQEPVIRCVRDTVFDQDKVLDLIKSRGINSNWDMVFLAYSYQIIRLCERLLPAKGAEVKELLRNQLDRDGLALLRDWARHEAADFVIDYAAFTGDFAKGNAQKAEMLTYLNEIAKERIGVDTQMFSRTSDLWELCQETFQEWYLGDARVTSSIGRESFQKGKKGFLADEIPLVDPAKLRELLLQLKEKGITLGIGTGRPTIETHVPLAELHLLDVFDPNRVISASHVLDAETSYPEYAPLAKPHPFCYLKGLAGLDSDDKSVLLQNLPIENPREVLIVGDSLADLLAARAIGCQFAATLTGLSGQAARSTMEKEKADYILNDVSEIMQIFN
ncbi:HAD family hydrolase [Brevibacillus fluminis]|uniref:HAD family hydrolase n=1 Tax=Brevibacillus fluminis TaxID=511487 RepID=A0A3M8D1N3_9BACL|nr:HAD family hydrolase [Brevibacillus fluminis]RNB81589.1 HAD family hydrolase [Brevibacillus fluminis]